MALAQPTDVVKVRFQAQARSPGEARRYCSTIDAYKTIAREEGVPGLWKGRLGWILIDLIFSIIFFGGGNDYFVAQELLQTLREMRL